MATAPPAPETVKVVRGLITLIDKIIRERGHGQVIVTIRDGKVMPIETRRTYLIENLPE